MKHIGLFEGIGGFSLAARWMGWETVAWCEWDAFCQRVLKYHFPEAEQHGDITATDFTRYAGQIDILTGGFPCQPYSSAGKRLGKEDDRHLWPEMLRAIREVQPRWVVGENVRGLTNWNGGLVFDEVQSDLENEGYEVTPYLLPACAVNAPHRRDRIWFVAYSDPDRYSAKRRKETEANRIPGINRQAMGSGVFNGTNIRQDATNSNEGKCKAWVREWKREDKEKTGAGMDNRPSRLGYNEPGSWQCFPTQSPVCSRNDGISNRLDGITFPKWREKSIGAYGNAIVPQIALMIFKAIQAYEQ